MIVGPRAVAPSRVAVVGSGPAGCITARRLADAGHEVTLIEAGPGDPIPDPIRSASFFGALEEPGWTWPNVVAERAQGQEPRRYLRGRGLGGCSAVNAMVAMTGPSEDFGAFASKRAQRQVLDDILTRPSSSGPLADALSRVVDVEPAKLLAANGQRCSAFDLYLAQHRERLANCLEIRVESEVAELVVTTGRRVVGVRLASGEFVSAERVVLCAGAIHSPVLLLRSGVTNPGVGVGLMDHPAIPFTLQLYRPVDASQPAVSGLVSWSSGLGSRSHDLQYLILEHLGQGAPGFGQVLVALMDVASVGSVTIDASGEPLVQFNMLDARSDRARLRHGVRQLVRILHGGGLWDDGSRNNNLGEVARDVFVDDEGSRLDSVPMEEGDRGDRELDEWIRQHVGAYVHASSSCRLDSAVGTGGALRGWQGVSVIDSSVMPMIPRASTQVPTMMLAEFLVGQLLVLLNSQA